MKRFFSFKLQWIDPKWIDFYEKCKNAIETFDVLVVRVHDIYANRILNVLCSMQEITLQTLPSNGETWTIEEFLEKNEESCRFTAHVTVRRDFSIFSFFLVIFFERLAAIELNRKSQMVSEAVEEVLNLVQNATQTFKTMISVDSDILNKGLIYFYLSFSLFAQFISSAFLFSIL